MSRYISHQRHFFKILLKALSTRCPQHSKGYSATPSSPTSFSPSKAPYMSTPRQEQIALQKPFFGDNRNVCPTLLRTKEGEKWRHIETRSVPGIRHNVGSLQLQVPERTDTPNTEKLYFV
jgi:hypothetical protein